MGDARFAPIYERVRESTNRVAALRQLTDVEVVEALAAASRERDPLIANVLATEATNRMRRADRIVESIPDALVSTDRDGRIVHVNAAAEGLLAATRESLLGIAVDDVLRIIPRLGAPLPPLRAAAGSSIALGPVACTLVAAGARRDAVLQVTPLVSAGAPAGLVISIRPPGPAAREGSVPESRGAAPRAAPAETLSPRVAARLDLAARTLALGAALIGTLVLVGWATGSTTLMAVIRGLPAMVPNTALSLLLSGLALAARSFRPALRPVRFASFTLAAVVAAIGALTILGYAWPGAVAIDGLLAPGARARGEPLRPAFLTAVALTLTAAGIATLGGRRWRGYPVSDLLGVAVASIGFVALAGYLYGVAQLYLQPGSPGGTGVALHTALALVTLGTALILAQPAQGLKTVAFGPLAGGVVLRRVALGAIPVSLALGALALAGVRARLYVEPAALAIQAGATIALAIALGWSAGLALDVRDRARQRVEGFFRSAVASSPDAVVIAASDGTIRYASERTRAVLGYEPDELVGHHVEDIVPLPLRDEHVRDRGRYAENPISRPMGPDRDLRALRRDGVEIPVEVSLAPVHTGDELLVMAAIRDVSARKAAEEAQARLAAIVTSSEDAIVGKTLSGIVTSWNHGAERLYGYTAAEAIGRRAETLFVPPERREEFKALLARLAHGEGIERIETQRVRADGTLVDVAMSFSPVRDPRGYVIGVSSIGHDITRRKQAHERLVASLEEKEALLREIHHRVKNNLQVTSGLLQLQAQNAKDEATRALFLESMNRIKSMALVHEKLYGTAGLASVEIAEYGRDLAVELMRVYAGPERGIDLAVEMEPARLDLDTSVNCGLILNELITNALKHAYPAGRRGRVRVGFTTLPDGSRELYVADDGVGLPPELDLAKATTMGARILTGLARQLDGSIHVDRTGGTRVGIRFRPVDPEQLRAIREAAR